MLNPGEEPRFIADAMLGKLARWLRLLGYDALYSQEEDVV
ncbi:MAG TPA: Mut7-C RNAse domain-containing protein, partial [Anaerolineae bacterium]|nr:Mut7-C RNAse domain-containing protein [Anaerolineae bacterium]